MLIDGRSWPEPVGAAIPDLKHGADRVLLNERLSNGICNLKVERFGEPVDVGRYRSQVGELEGLQVISGETEVEQVFVMHMFWKVSDGRSDDCAVEV